MKQAVLEQIPFERYLDIDIDIVWEKYLDISIDTFFYYYLGIDTDINKK